MSDAIPTFEDYVGYCVRLLMGNLMVNGRTIEESLVKALTTMMKSTNGGCGDGGEGERRWVGKDDGIGMEDFKVNTTRFYIEEKTPKLSRSARRVRTALKGIS